MLAVFGCHANQAVRCELGCIAEQVENNLAYFCLVLECFAQFIDLLILKAIAVLVYQRFGSGFHIHN